MPRLDTILFDLDGTLIDSVRLILDSYHHTLASHGLPPRTDEEWLRGVGTPLSVQFAELGGDPLTLEALIAVQMVVRQHRVIAEPVRPPVGEQVRDDVHHPAHLVGHDVHHARLPAHRTARQARTVIAHCRALSGNGESAPDLGSRHGRATKSSTA